MVSGEHRSGVCESLQYRDGWQPRLALGEPQLVLGEPRQYERHVDQLGPLHDGRCARRP